MPAARTPLRWLGLEQRWAMFVPPPVEGGWHVFKGQTWSGEWVDLLALRHGVSEAQPEHIHAIYPNVRCYLHCAYFLRGAHPRSKALPAPAADFLRRRWEQRREDRLRRVELLLLRSYSPESGYSQPVREQLWHQELGL